MASNGPSIPYNFFGNNREAILCRKPEVILSGPAETGKTLAWLFKLHTLAYRYPGCQLAIIRKRKTDIAGTAFHTLKRDLLDDYGPGIEVYGGQYPQHINYPGGSRIWLGGMDDPGKTLSAERDVIYVNQAEELSLSDWEFLTRTVTGRGAVMPYTQLVGDVNPQGPTHWILLRRKSRTNPDGALAFLPTTHMDNPTLWDHALRQWTEQGLKTRGRLGRMTGSRRERLFLGLWVAPEGAIYQIFDEEVHKVVAFPIPRLWPRFVGIDPVGAHIAAVWLAMDPRRKIMHLYREYKEPFGAPTRKHVQNILELSGYTKDGAGTMRAEPIHYWVVGAKSERQAREDWRVNGIPGSPPAIVDVWSGIDMVNELLHDNALVIHDSCHHTLGEVASYRRTLDKHGIVTDKIHDKGSFHCLDAGRYAIVGPDRTGDVEEEVLTLPQARIA